MIDLDLPPARPPRRSLPLPRLRRVTGLRVPLFVVVLVTLLAAGAGAAAGWRLTVSRHDAREAGEVMLFAGVADLDVGTFSGGRATIDGTIWISNGGPRPVEVAGAPDAAGLTVRSRQRIERGASVSFSVSTTIPCSDAHVGAVPLDLSAGTWNGQWTKVTLAVPSFGTPWYADFDRTCRAGN
ncbi:hypothetical protein KZZ52_25195 [Dactylosporangium sp. AC04546]|uniref:hypothetical protein n=1 Tax=Dactylosporangium sp. AC04546 TaxID=2862460 RepID=UPI001EDDE6B8|nr:hypothetical protein [Dactylosporangium sp. AC04546]WVK88567.1 hypothetical protein KZZ52_25195 [Dactylosporangium sp. AC04546]